MSGFAENLRCQIKNISSDDTIPDLLMSSYSLASGGAKNPLHPSLLFVFLSSRIYLSVVNPDFQIALFRFLNRLIWAFHVKFKESLWKSKDQYLEIWILTGAEAIDYGKYISLRRMKQANRSSTYERVISEES